MARLTSVAIRRFKRIEHIEIPLDDVTLLIGANNSGKSSILQPIHFAVSIAQTARLVGEGVAWRQDTFELSPKEERYMSAGVARRIVARGDANLTLRNVLRMLSGDYERWADLLLRAVET
jgi:recombinational DNA repair ATPase RecF